VYRQLCGAVTWLAKWTALLGGTVLIGVVVMTCVSIIGRALTGFGLKPIPGDFELVEMGVGFAVFSALPWCHLNRAHARVDLFETALGKPANRVINVIADLLMLIAAGLIAYRLSFGMIDKKNYSETTFILQLPVWYAYAAAMLGAVVFVIVAAFSLLRTAREVAGESTQ